MFFEINDEKRIGYKCLTDADLGKSVLSHQTHIGLFDDVLTFLPNDTSVDDALLIYENKCMTLEVSFGRILRANGDYNSPNIKTGGRDVVSIVSNIREIAREKPKLDWYLFWFGLKSSQPVFFLFNNTSEAFRDITDMGITLSEKVKSRLTVSDDGFSTIMQYLENIVNTSGENIIRELEIVSQTGVVRDGIKLRSYDIKKARDNFELIGKSGEDLVNKFLKIMQLSGQIISYTWFNESSESGLPYDFSIQELSGNIIYLDVKSTTLGSEQPIIFSNQELNFISTIENQYHVYRVYDIEQEEKHLRICKNYKNYASELNTKINKFVKDIQTINANIQAAKIIVPTDNTNFLFGNEILLP